MNALLFDVTTLGGVVMLITVGLNFAKQFGWVAEGTSEKLSATVQSTIALILTGVGMYFPAALDVIPALDNAAALLADLGIGVFALIPILAKLGNLYHDIISKIPGVNKVFGKQLTA